VEDPDPDAVPVNAGAVAGQTVMDNYIHLATST
jgi:hypothetical protein